MYKKVYGRKLHYNHLVHWFSSEECVGRESLKWLLSLSLRKRKLSVMKFINQNEVETSWKLSKIILKVSTS